MIEIMECINDAMLEETAALAAKIWHEYFSSLLTPDQIDYMVEKFQSREAMKRQVETEQYGYWQVRQDGTLIGYIGLQFQKDRLFLSKLYLRQESRGQGIASRMLAKVYDTVREFGYDRLWLTCNKHNRHSLDVYAAKGFVCIGEDVTDIGQGYVMDDYFLEKPCEPKNSMRTETTRFLSVFFQLQALSRDGTQTHRKREFKTLILIKDTIL